MSFFVTVLMCMAWSCIVAALRADFRFSELAGLIMGGAGWTFILYVAQT